MSRWVEVADGVLMARYQPHDVNVTVVRGTGGLLVVDTRSNHREADEILADLADLGAPVRWVVNTHAHFDHTFGNARFGRSSQLGATIYGHRRVPDHLSAYEVPMLARWVEDEGDPRGPWHEVVITEPDVLVDDRGVLDLGDRQVDLLHLGRGHTDNDLLLHVGDADTWLVGDLVEQSGPPMYGSGSCPLDWPGTVSRLVRLVGESTVVVPGHGTPVDRAFVAAQQAELATVADVIRELHGAGVPVADAVSAGAGRWPFPVAGMESAVRDGYAQLS